jgi:hypothetical protein
MYEYFDGGSREVQPSVHRLSGEQEDPLAAKIEAATLTEVVDA